MLSIVKLERSALLFILGWSVIGLFSLGIVSLLSNLYVLKLGFDISFLGILNGSSQIIWALLAFPAGMIGTRFGLRKSVIAAYYVASLGMVIFLSAIWMPMPFWAGSLLLGNGLVGVAGALVTVTGIPYLMAVTPEKDRNKAFTLQTALFTLLAFIGSLVAGSLPAYLIHILPGITNEAMAFNVVMWSAVPAYILTALLLRGLKPEPKIAVETKIRASAAAPVATLLFLGLFVGLQISSENTLGMFINVYFANNLQQPAVTIGEIFAAARLLPFLFSPLQPLALNRWGAGLVLSGGYLLVAVCLLIMALVPTLAVGVALYMLLNVIISFTGTGRYVYSQEVVQAQWRTTSSAVISISQAIAGGLIGFCAGAVLNAAGFRGMFLSGSALALAAILIYAIWQARANRRLVNETAG
jgi:MFS family permease